MSEEREHDFAMEKRLREMSPELHRRFTDAVFGLQKILSNYKLIFPEYTDHSELHSLTVIDFCNNLMGKQVEKLNADELYALLVACYFHDTGMGISHKDYEQFSKEIDFGDYFETHSRDNLQEIIRNFHNEFSGRFIKKYAPFFEIPSEEHLWAIMQIARGHRKTKLMDEKEYPVNYKVPGGNEICLPYLAALIRLADEIDVAAFRNSKLLYHLEAIVDEKQIVEHKRHQAVKDLIISEKAFTLLVDTQEEEIKSSIFRMAEKMQITLDVCRRVVEEHTPYMITQEKIIVETMA